jgi:hypothetical protein
MAYAKLILYPLGCARVNMRLNLTSPDQCFRVSSEILQSLADRPEERASAETRIQDGILGGPNGPPDEKVCHAIVRIVRTKCLGVFARWFRDGFE